MSRPSIPHVYGQVESSIFKTWWRRQGERKQFIGVNSAMSVEANRQQFVDVYQLTKQSYI
eukprot:15455509-Alexandrium_andersonii.AAC.1